MIGSKVFRENSYPTSAAKWKHKLTTELPAVVCASRRDDVMAIGFDHADIHQELALRLVFEFRILHSFSICDIINSTMPRWIYNRPPDKCQSTEIRFAQSINNLLPDNWIVRWGYWYEDDRGILREGDFLVLGPHGGLAVLEVKTSISHLAPTGQWDTDDGDNPLTQLMAEHAGVVRRIQSVAGGRRLPFVSKSLVFPLTEIASGISEYRGIPRSLILAANDVKDFPAAWRRLFNGQVPVKTEQVAAFLDAYGEGLEPKAVKAFITETDKLILRQATASYRLLDMLSGNLQLVVEGGVGTGKSWYAIEQARRLAENAGADSGRDVLMVAYNLALCERLRASAGKLRLERGSITVHSSESIAASILEALGIPHEVPLEKDAKERYFNETLPLLAIEALMTERGTLVHLLGQFDALVVDEAQDHDTALPGISSYPDHAGWWSIYAALLRHGWQSPMAIFGDAAQRPPFRVQNRFCLDTVRQKLTQHAHLRLNRALRYTRPIYRFLKSLDSEGSCELSASLQTDGQLPDGPEVEIYQTTEALTSATVQQILDRWKTSGLCAPSKVLILHDRSQISSTPLAGLDQLLDHPLRPYLETLDQAADDAIGHTSIHKAKGLDALAVILIGLPSYDQLTRPHDRFTYFMGASRARQLLACVHTE